MINLDDFLKLSDEEKEKRYIELSGKDRLAARMSDWKPGDTIVLKSSASPQDAAKQKEIIRQLEKAVEQGKIHLLK